jgi:hypothetical protein
MTEAGPTPATGDSIGVASRYAQAYAAFDATTLFDLLAADL